MQTEYFLIFERMKNQAKILFISQEIDPYINESEMALICRKLPQYVQERGCEIRVFMPCYGHVNERRNQLHEVQRLSGLNIIISDNDHPLLIKVASIQSARVQVYFIDNDDFFHRKGIARDEDRKPFDDNDERSIFFVRSVLETIKKLRWTPDIVLCSGWISALAPMFIKCSYITDPFFAKSKVVYSLYKERMMTPLRPGVDSRMAFDFITKNDYHEFNGQTRLTSEMLDHIAVRYSDAVIAECEVISDTIAALIQERNIPLLEYAPVEEAGDRHYKFFGQISPAFQNE